MEYICDLSSSKAALPVQKYVEEYSIITKFKLNNTAPSIGTFAG